MLGPNIIGDTKANMSSTMSSNAPDTYGDGSLRVNLSVFTNRGSSNGTTGNITFNAHDSNSVYTDSGKVYPLSLALNFIIKS